MASSRTKKKPTKKKTARNLLTATQESAVSTQIDNLNSGADMVTSAINSVLGFAVLTEGELEDHKRLENVKVPDVMARFYSVLYDVLKRIKSTGEGGTDFVKMLSGAQWEQDKLAIEFKQTERRSPQWKSVAVEQARERWKLLDYVSDLTNGDLDEDEAAWLKLFTKNGEFDSDAFEKDLKDNADSKVSTTIKVSPK